MKLFNRVVCFIITSVILLSTFSFSLPLLISADNIKYQIGYTFDNQYVPGEDISGIKNLPDNNTYSITDGYNGTKGNSAKFTEEGFVKIRVHTVDTADYVAPEFEGSVPNATARASNPNLVANPLPQDEFEEKLLEFVKEMITKMGYEVTVEVMFREEKKIGIKLTSASSSILIGRKGKNLDAMQLLVNVYAGHLGREDIRIILDTENYQLITNILYH